MSLVNLFELKNYFLLQTLQTLGTPVSALRSYLQYR